MHLCHPVSSSRTPKRQFPQKSAIKYGHTLFPQKSPMISGSFAKETGNLRHPMHLRHPVLSSRTHVRHPWCLLTYLWGSFDIFVCWALLIYLGEGRSSHVQLALAHKTAPVVWIDTLWGSFDTFEGLFWRIGRALLWGSCEIFVGIIWYTCSALLIYMWGSFYVCS